MNSARSIRRVLFVLCVLAGSCAPQQSVAPIDSQPVSTTLEAHDSTEADSEPVDAPEPTAAPASTTTSSTQATDEPRPTSPPSSTTIVSVEAIETTDLAWGLGGIGPVLWGDTVSSTSYQLMVDLLGEPLSVTEFVISECAENEVNVAWDELSLQFHSERGLHSYGVFSSDLVSEWGFVLGDPVEDAQLKAQDLTVEVSQDLSDEGETTYWQLGDAEYPGMGEEVMHGALVEESGKTRLDTAWAFSDSYFPTCGGGA